MAQVKVQPGLGLGQIGQIDPSGMDLGLFRAHFWG